MNPLQDDELDHALAKLQAPATPPDVEAKAVHAYRQRGRWRRWFSIEVRVPLPAAVAVLALLVALSVMLVRVGNRRQPETPRAWGGLQPVGELRPVIIRGRK